MPDRKNQDKIGMEMDIDTIHSNVDYVQIKRIDYNCVLLRVHLEDGTKTDYEFEGNAVSGGVEIFV